MERKNLMIELMNTYSSAMKQMKKELEMVLSDSLPMHEFVVLRLLTEQDSYTVSNLAKKLDVSNSHITAVSDRLIQKDLINRTRNETDRRIVNLSLTSLGKERANEVQEEIYLLFEGKLNEKNEDQLSQFNDLLKSLAG
jgi:DNA-binding MarR family transcriptional regulator